MDFALELQVLSLIPLALSWLFPVGQERLQGFEICRWIWFTACPWFAKCTTSIIVRQKLFVITSLELGKVMRAKKRPLIAISFNYRRTLV